MPSVNFSVVWPDGEKIEYYSPSTVIHEYLSSNTSYSLEEFSEKVFSGLDMASARVMKKFGYACSAAADEKRKIALKLESLAKDNVSEPVTVFAIS